MLSIPITLLHMWVCLSIPNIPGSAAYASDPSKFQVAQCKTITYKLQHAPIHL